MDAIQCYEGDGMLPPSHHDFYFEVGLQRLWSDGFDASMTFDHIEPAMAEFVKLLNASSLSETAKRARYEQFRRELDHYLRCDRTGNAKNKAVFGLNLENERRLCLVCIGKADPNIRYAI